jgi:peptidoglycan-N-acetylmuramic acid deacetylase
MDKLLNKISLLQKYKKLSTEKDKKIFILLWSTIFVSAFTIIFVCCCGIYLNKNKSSKFIANNFNYTNHKSINQKSESNIHSIIDKNLNTGQQEKTKSSETIKAELNPTNDLAKNDNSKIRKTIYMGATTTTQAAITFDDGYNKKYVQKVLDVLKKNNVKCTFFIIGKVLDDYPEVWKRAVKEGHQICNHTQSHKILTNKSDEVIQAEISVWEESARKVFGDDYLKRMKKEFPYLRLPGGGGAKSDRILAIAQKNGYKVIGWNLETFSSVINPLKNKKSVEEISDRIEQHVVNNCSGGAIILFHFNQYDMGNIEDIVIRLKNRGFNMQTISQIIK